MINRIGKYLIENNAQNGGECCSFASPPSRVTICHWSVCVYVCELVYYATYIYFCPRHTTCNCLLIFTFLRDNCVCMFVCCLKNEIHTHWHFFVQSLLDFCSDHINLEGFWTTYCWSVVQYKKEIQQEAVYMLKYLNYYISLMICHLSSLFCYFFFS